MHLKKFKSKTKAKKSKTKQKIDLNYSDNVDDEKLQIKQQASVVMRASRKDETLKEKMQRIKKKPNILLPPIESRMETDFSQKQTPNTFEREHHQTDLLKKIEESPEANLSHCIHIITGYVKELTDKLVQSKLKWSQECLISDMKSNEYQAYLSNDPIELLLDLTCLQAKDIFKKSKELNVPPSENQYVILFDQKRANYCEKLTKIIFSMHLKFDFEKEMFCVFKIENIQER